MLSSYRTGILPFAVCSKLGCITTRNTSFDTSQCTFAANKIQIQFDDLVQRHWSSDFIPQLVQSLFKIFRDSFGILWNMLSRLNVIKELAVQRPRLLYTGFRNNSLREKIFRQVSINTEGKKSLWIFWRKSSQYSVEECRLTGVPFGMASAPFPFSRCIF